MSMYGSGESTVRIDQKYILDKRPIAGDANAGAGLPVFYADVEVAATAPKPESRVATLLPAGTAWR
jgi:hypothetical protein